MNFFTKMLGLIFPVKGGFDFSKAATTNTGAREELYGNLPKCSDMRGATALAGKRVFAVLSYRHPTVRALIWQIKFKKNAYAMRCGGYFLHRGIADLAKSPRAEKLKIPKLPHCTFPILVIPMPISPARRRERGYNQCELLAEAMLRFEKININSLRFELRTDILTRIKNVKKQTFKNRRERMENMQGVFEVRPVKDMPYTRTILILDDVITTGSSMREAMDCLERAGYADVWGIGLAH